MLLPMIPFRFWSQFKNKWLACQEAKLLEEFTPQLVTLRKQLSQQLCELQQQSEQFTARSQELQRQLALVTDQELLVADKKIALEKTNEELRTQLRLLEAKAAPDRIWVEAFSRGYEVAWQTMWPLLFENLQRAKGAIEQIAIDQTIARLEETVIQRATELGQTQARSLLALRQKQEEFKVKYQQATERQDQGALQRYEHYLEALRWMLHADGLYPNQPAT